MTFQPREFSTGISWTWDYDIAFGFADRSDEYGMIAEYPFDKMIANPVTRTQMDSYMTEKEVLVLDKFHVPGKNKFKVPLLKAWRRANS